MGWGDELMMTGQARELQRRDPRKVRIAGDEKFHDAWLNNPRIAQPGEQGDFQPLPRRDADGLRAYIVAKTWKRWTWRAWGPPAGELYFTDEERAFGAAHGGRVILEPHVKPGASPNKQWGWARWSALARMAKDRGCRVTQVGPAGTARLDGADFILTRSMRLAAAVMAEARAAVLPEGGLHHVAAAVGAPAVVIFGGFISPAVTGYADQVSLFAGDGLGCGLRVPCGHCAEAMDRIEPATVCDRLMELLQ